MRLELLLAGVIALGVATAAQAQFTQYSPPGGGSEDDESMKEALTKLMEQARWSVGPVKIEPWVGVGRVTYFKDLFPQREGNQSDFAVSAGAGITAFMPLGPRVLVAGHALPEFRWWKEYNKRNRWNGKYGLGVFADTGRLRIDLRTFKAREPWYLGYDNEVPIDVRREGARLDSEVRLFPRFSLFASGEQIYWRYSDSDLDDGIAPRLTTLDRDERRISGGILYRLGTRTTLMFGQEKSKTDFLVSTYDQSNTGTAPVVGLTYTGARLDASVRFSEYALKPTEASQFVPFDGRTGRARIDWRFSELSRLSLYGTRALSFRFGGTDYFQFTRMGAAFRFPVGYRLRASVFGESGTHDYLVAGRASEDVRSYGATASVRLRQRGSLNMRWERATYQAEGMAASRSTSRFHFGLDFGFGSAVVW